MKFGLFYEHQLPRPWSQDSEYQIYQDSLAQVELADGLGFDYVWAVEHHFLEEYSHLAAPEVFLAACSQRTERIRLGHGIVQVPPAFNHPAKVAERIATLDLISHGRVDFGTGESNSRMELEGFNIDRELKTEMWAEATEQIAEMMVSDPYPGYAGRFFSMPVRNVVPKPLQRPHPPMWVACSSLEGIRHAARNGLGALTFAFVESSTAAEWVDEYYSIIKSECRPIGHSVNANIAMVTGLFCNDGDQEAEKRAIDGLRFFGYALAHYYFFGWHQPSVTDIWQDFIKTNPPVHDSLTRGTGTPDKVAQSISEYEAAGVDQLIFLQQCGNNRHEDICRSMKMFSAGVMPEFVSRREEAERKKQADLAPYIEQAMKRKRTAKSLPVDDIPRIPAYGKPSKPTGFMPKKKDRKKQAEQTT